MNSGGVSVDESRGYLIVNDIRLPTENSPTPLHAVNAPRGMVTAIDLSSRQIVWQIPMGMAR